jgi:phage portal protein BeeE
MAIQTKARQQERDIQAEIEEFKESLPESRGRPALAPNPDMDKYDYNKLLEDLKTKSNVIRFLHSRNFSRTDIAKFTGLRYQHVRNVLLMPLTKSPPIATEDNKQE